MARDRDISDLDIFADRVQLKFNGMRKFKTVCGGLMSTCWFITMAFVLSMCLKSLFTGYYINGAITHTDMVLTDDGWKSESELTDSEIMFGFKNSPTVLSNTEEAWQSFPAAIGRFELLHVEKKDSDSDVVTTRLNFAACSSDSNANCWEHDDGAINIYGDIT